MRRGRQILRAQNLGVARQRRATRAKSAAFDATAAAHL